MMDKGPITDANGINQNNKSPPFNEGFERNNLSDADREVARTVATCFVQSAGLSLGAGYIAFRGTGHYISVSGTPFMKSWSSVIKFGVGLFAFTTMRSMYGRGVCLKRIENLPPSRIREKVLMSFSPDRIRDSNSPWFNKDDAVNDNSNAYFSTRYQAHIGKGQQQPQIDPEQVDFKNHETDTGKEVFDKDQHSHNSDKVNEFDYSRNYDLPPAEMTSQQPKVIRRNKYGDIIEDV